MNPISGNWTPAQRAELLKMVSEQAIEQIERDPELRAMADWMIESCDLKPSPELYRLLLLNSSIMTLAGP